MTTSSKKIDWLIPSIFMLVQLLFFYFIKYENQGLPVSEFSLSNTGNIFNLLIILLTITGFFIVSKQPGNKISVKLIFTFIILTSSVLLIAFIGIKIQLPGKKSIILDQPVDKLLSASLFMLYFIILLMFVSVLWVSIFSKSKVSLIKSLLNSIIMLIIFLLISYLFISSKTFESGKWILSKEKNNIAFVLGAAVWSENQPSPTLSSRVDKAIHLFNQGFVGKIFLTGSNAPGELAEATVALNYAVSKGMQKEFFMIETLTGSTNQQILFLKENLLKDKNINEIIIVSDAYHLPRVIEICRFYNVDVKVTSSDHPLTFKDKLLNNLRESVAMFTFLCFAL